MAEPKFEISLAAWSMHRMFFAREIDQMGMRKALFERYQH